MASPQAKRKSGQIVVPGDRLGVIEEFTPGPGTYESEGTIYSAATGRALMDLLNKQVTVYPKAHISSVPHVGTTVTGQVSEVQNKQATIRIFQVGDRSLSGFFSGLLHIGDVSPRYVESMYDVCKAGDIVRARVVSDKNRVFHLTTNDKDLGVVYSFCSRCGHPLSQKRFIMRCPECGNSERRKTAADYDKGEI
ncbi:MAG TPA: exosome complex RNA-binding protein Csl4 [Candidatus Bathyarchaeia archaeon]|nr:exosome complex RNA-binding protein Csl4 [Candidatus Bathyarchaeia archaeon]